MITTKSKMMPTYHAQGVTGSIAERMADGGGPHVTYSTTCRPSMATRHQPPAPPATPGGQARPVKSYHPYKSQENERLNCSQSKDACMMGIRSKIKENMNNKGDCSDLFYTPRQQYTPRYDQSWSPMQPWRTVPAANMDWRPDLQPEGPSQVNAVARALGQANSSRLLPPPRTVKWDGLRSSFPRFLLKFDTTVEKHCESADQAFEYLLEALPERDQVLIAHLADINDDSGQSGYRLAREALETAFGGEALDRGGGHI